MKNTFSPIELQVISNLLDAGSIAYVEADMLREKIQRLKANPPTLRETAAQFTTDLIDGTIEDPNPQRLEAAKVVLEAYWSFDESKIEPSLPMLKLDEENLTAEGIRQKREREAVGLPPDHRTFSGEDGWKENLAAGVENGLKFQDESTINRALDHFVECPPDCDSKLAHTMLRDYVKTQQESMKGSVRIKDLDCSTPTEKTQKQKDYKFTHEPPIRGDRPTGQFGDFLLDGGYPIPNATADFGSRKRGNYPIAGGPVRQYHQMGLEPKPTPDLSPSISDYAPGDIDFAKIAVEEYEKRNPVADDEPTFSVDKNSEMGWMGQQLANRGIVSVSFREDQPARMIITAVKSIGPIEILCPNCNEVFTKLGSVLSEPVAEPVARCLRCNDTCIESIEGLCKICSDRKKAYNYAFWNEDGPFALKEPMTLERAVAVLNERLYDSLKWQISTTESWAKDYGISGYTTLANDPIRGIKIFEAIAIAEKLEREK